MPNSQSCGKRDFSKLDDMTDAELEEILRLDAKKPEGEETDLEMLLYVMEVLAGRKRNKENAGKSPEEAFESFKQNYMPQDDPNSILKLDSQEETPESPAKKSRWLRGLSAVAAALAIVIVCSVTAGAFGIDILGTVAKWTRETFHFGSGLQETNPVVDTTGELSPLQEVLYKKKIDTPLAPTWIPDGYELVDVKIDETPVLLNILAIYRNEEQVMKIQIKAYLDRDPQQVERSDSLVEVYQSNGIAYYVFEDYNQLRAVWINENYECYISGELTVEEMRSMIDSIQKE